jgi:hypothetical protein
MSFLFLITDILTDFFSVIGTLFVVCYASPIIIAVVVPLIIVFFIIQVSSFILHNKVSYFRTFFGHSSILFQFMRLV